MIPSAKLPRTTEFWVQHDLSHLLVLHDDGSRTSYWVQSPREPSRAPMGASKSVSRHLSKALPCGTLQDAHGAEQNQQRARGADLCGICALRTVRKGDAEALCCLVQRVVAAGLVRPEDDPVGESVFHTCVLNWFNVAAWLLGEHKTVY